MSATGRQTRQLCAHRRLRHCDSGAIKKCRLAAMRNSRKATFYAPFLFFPVPVVASLLSAFTAGAADAPEAAEATVSASDDALLWALRTSHHSIKGLAM